MKQNHGQEVIYRVGIVRMSPLDLSEFLNRSLIVHVIEVIEGGATQWIGGPERELLDWFGRRLLSMRRLGRKAWNQRHCQAQARCEGRKQGNGSVQKFDLLSVPET